MAVLLSEANCFGNSNSSIGLSELAEIRFEQRLDSQLSLGVQFTDDSGRAVQLESFFSGKPVVLMLGYYGCPMLCGAVLNGFVEALQDLKATPGKDFEVVFISIDPSETPDLAREKKSRYLKRYGRPYAADGWHFLTGTQAASAQLAAEIGFHYQYDPASKQYAHPSGFVVLTPQGKIARYFLGVTYSASELSVALKQASANQIGAPVQNLLLLCFHYSPITGKYGLLVMTTVRITAALTVLVLASGLLMHLRRARAKGGST